MSVWRVSMRCVNSLYYARFYGGPLVHAYCSVDEDAYTRSHISGFANVYRRRRSIYRIQYEYDI